jgi:hypothetical protein
MAIAAKWASTSRLLKKYQGSANLLAGEAAAMAGGVVSQELWRQCADTWLCDGLGGVPGR